jgi:plasmid stabilization system protein ParE
MGWKVIFSRRSEADLRRIVEYIARDDPAAAERFGLALIRSAEALVGMPEAGVAMPGAGNARFIPHGSHLIIYRADKSQETVRILRFWHSARGWRPRS